MHFSHALIAFMFLAIIVLIMKSVNTKRREETKRLRASEAEVDQLAHQLLIERAKLSYLSNEYNYKKVRSGFIGRLFVDRSEQQKQAKVVNHLKIKLDRLTGKKRAGSFMR